MSFNRLISDNCIVELKTTSPSTMVSRIVGYAFSTSASDGSGRQGWVLYEDLQNVEGPITLQALTSALPQSWETWIAAVSPTASNGLWKSGATYVDVDCQSVDDKERAVVLIESTRPPESKSYPYGADSVDDGRQFWAKYLPIQVGPQELQIHLKLYGTKFDLEALAGSAEVVSNVEYWLLPDSYKPVDATSSLSMGVRDVADPSSSLEPGELVDWLKSQWLEDNWDGAGCTLVVARCAYSSSPPQARMAFA